MHITVTILQFITQNMIKTTVGCYTIWASVGCGLPLYHKLNHKNFAIKLTLIIHSPVWQFNSGEDIKSLMWLHSAHQVRNKRWLPINLYPKMYPSAPYKWYQWFMYSNNNPHTQPFRQDIIFQSEYITPEPKRITKWIDPFADTFIHLYDGEMTSHSGHCR